MVVFACAELKKIQESCICVDSLQAHIVFFVKDMRFNYFMRL